MARGRLDLRPVPVRFAQAALQSKVVERDGFDLPPRRVQGAGQLEHQSRVGRVGVPQPLGHGDPLALVGSGPQRGDLALRLVLAPGGDDLAPDGTGVVGSRSQPMQPLRDLGALLMAHEGHDVTVPDRTHHRRDALGLGVERLRLNDADPAEPSPEVALDVLDRAAPQVLPLVGQNHVVGPLAGELTEALDGLVGAVPRRAEAQVDPATLGREPVGDLEERLQAGLVVSHVEDDRGAAALGRRHRVGVEAPLVEDGIGLEGAQSFDDGGPRHTQSESSRGASEGVGDVVPRQPGEGDRHVDDLGEAVGVGTRREDDDVPVEDGDPAAAGRQRLAQRRRIRVEAEGPRLGADAVPHRPDPRVVAVEDDPAPRLGDRRDDGLDLGELVQGVDPLEAEMVGRDVGDDADVVRGDAHALEQHPAPGRLEHPHLEARRREDRTGSCRAGEVALLDRLSHHHDTGGRAPGGPEPGRHGDVRHDARGRRLAVECR